MWPLRMPARLRRRAFWPKAGRKRQSPSLLPQLLRFNPHPRPRRSPRRKRMLGRRATFRQRDHLQLRRKPKSPRASIPSPALRRRLDLRTNRHPRPRLRRTSQRAPTTLPRVMFSTATSSGCCSAKRTAAATLSAVIIFSRGQVPPVCDQISVAVAAG